MNIEDKNSDNATQQFFGGSGALSKSKRLGVRHAMGRNWYLFKVEWYLESKVSGRRRKSILADLREGIDAETHTFSLQKVLAGLGRPGELAASYAEGEHTSGPLWGTGVAAAMIILLAYWLFFSTFVAGMLAIVGQTGGEFEAHFLFVKVLAFSGDNGVGIGWSGKAALWVPLILAAAAFIPTSRFWRIFTRRR